MFWDMGSLGDIKDQRIAIADHKLLPKTPSFYFVSIVDSNDCTLDLYAALLQSVFQMQNEESYSIAVKIKWHGSIQIGKFTKDVAETKINLARNYTDKLRLNFECILVKVGGYAF